MRKLATIRTISNIDPIEGRDQIGLATIDGWKVIVRFEDFNVGDKCVYCEIDSVLPDKPEFEHLRSKNFRIKTMKMAGVLSQGIAFSLRILPEGEYNVGDDVTDIIGVKQYVAGMDAFPERKVRKLTLWQKFLKMLGVRKYQNNMMPCPSFIKKTDQERVQNIPWMVDKIKSMSPETVYISEKLDGSSATYLLEKKLFGYKFTVCSRNYALKDSPNDRYWQIARKYDIKNKLIDFMKQRRGGGTKLDWVCIQGEMVGPKIQENRYHLKDLEFYVFNLITDEGGLFPQGMNVLSLEGYGFKFVPMVDTKKFLDSVNNVEDILKKADGKSALYSGGWREGVVIRNWSNTISFKVISNKFLLKNKL